MATKQKTIYAGSICLIAGGVLTVFGTIRLVSFLHRIQDFRAISASQLFCLLVVPHVLLLVGVGLVTAAFVLFTRRMIIRKRQQLEER